MKIMFLGQISLIYSAEIFENLVNQVIIILSSKFKKISQTNNTRMSITLKPFQTTSIEVQQIVNLKKWAWPV